jgi:hypothetical protein
MLAELRVSDSTCAAGCRGDVDRVRVTDAFGGEALRRLRVWLSCEVASGDGGQRANERKKIRQNILITVGICPGTARPRPSFANYRDMRPEAVHTATASGRQYSWMALAPSRSSFHTITHNAHSHYDRSHTCPCTCPCTCQLLQVSHSLCHCPRGL